MPSNVSGNVRIIMKFWELIKQQLRQNWRKLTGSLPWHSTQTRTMPQELAKPLRWSISFMLTVPFFKILPPPLFKGGGEVCTLIGNVIQYKILGETCWLVFIVINLILFVKSLIWLDVYGKLRKLSFGTFLLGASGAKDPPKH